MIWLLEFLIIVALGVSLRRAFVRIDELGRANETLKQRVDGAESLLVALARELRPAKPARAPEVPVQPEVARGVRPASASEPVPQVRATPEAGLTPRATSG